LKSTDYEDPNLAVFSSFQIFSSASCSQYTNCVFSLHILEGKNIPDQSVSFLEFILLWMPAWKQFCFWHIQILSHCFINVLAIFIVWCGLHSG